MTITQQPDALSLSGNLKKLIFSGVSAPLSFSLSVGGGVILTQQYSPDADGQVIIDIKDVVESHLSLTFSDVQVAYQQSGVVRDFSYSVNAGAPVTFRVIRAGIDAFADTAANFLAANFLTWQPQIKNVTYYTPENLTYYAAVAALVKLKLYYADGDPVTVTLDTLTSGKCWTIPVTYARILAASGSEVLPGAYDIWIENGSGNRLTYIQRYIADSLPAEDESWVIFENSLGGFDTFRATGTDDLTGTHTHNLAEVDGISEDYRVDTERVHKKSTGYLDMKQRLWLLDFFPSRRKWVYISSAMRSIVLTEDEVTYTINNMPSEFSFSYKYADAKPYLNIARVQTLPTVLQIVTPDLQSFSLPPRLVEFSHQTITEGALLPVQNPYSDVWGAVTFGSIVDFVSSRLGMPSGGGVSAWSPNSLLAVDANGQVGSLQEVAHSNLLLASNIGAAPSYKSIDAILGLNAEGYVRRSAAGVYSTDLNLTASDYVRIGTSKFVATESGLNLIGSDGSSRSLCVFGGIFSGGIADFGEVGGAGYNSIIHLGSGNVITSLVDNGSTLEAHRDLLVYSQSQVNGLISTEVTNRNTAISDAINLLDVADGAQVNVLEGVKLNGTALSPTSKVVNVNACASITVPTGLSVASLTTGGLIAISLATGYAIPTSVNIAQIATNATNITTLQGYFTDGSAKSAIKLLNARTLWGQSFDGTAKVSGNMTGVGSLDASGDIRTSERIYGAKGIFSGGIADLGETISSGYNLISTTGTGNAVTSVDDNGSTLNIHKDITFALASDVVNSLATKVDKVAGYGLSKNDLSDILLAALNANTAARHSHANKALLDTYAQTESNLANAVSLKHTHSNKPILDATTASFLSADRTKLDGIATGANLYVHPSYTAQASGLYKVTVDSSGHVSAVVAVVKSDITALGIPAQDTVYVHPSSGVTAGTYRSVTVDVNGHVTTGTNPTTLVGYGITDAASASALSTLDANIDACIGSLAGQLLTLQSKNQFDELYSEYGHIRTLSSDLLVGYLKGNADTATKLYTARTLWGQSFDGTAKVSGNMTGVGSLDASGDIRTSERIYGAKGIFSGGIADLGETISSGYNLISTTGTGNAVTSVDDNGSTLNIHKDITFALASDVVNSLATKVDKVAGYGLSKNDLSDILLAALNANTAARHSHANKALLDTYAQTESNLANAVSLKHTHSNKPILDATTASFLAADRLKLDGIAANANNYSLPIASSDVLGGIKVGSRLTITSGVLSADVQSDYNFNSNYKTKLDGIAANANLYVHPSYTARASGLYKVTVDSSGHVSAVVAVVKSDITALGIPAQDTVYVHPSSGVTAGTYRSVTVDVNGHVTTGTNPTTLVGYGITDAASASALSTLDANIDACIGSLAGQLLTLQSKNQFDELYSEYGHIRTLSSDLLVGYLKGNADTATKLYTARTLWGQSFDGTAKVSGNMTGVGSLDASGDIRTSERIYGAKGIFSGGIADLGETISSGYNLISTTGTGNAVTSVDDNGSTLNIHKDITFALASDVVNSLATKVDKVAGYGLSKNDLSDVLLAALNANTAARHSHANKALLDTYAQTESNLASAVSLKHTHSNKTILDATTASFLAADRIKLDGIAANANNYSLPAASSTVLGGIKVGSRLTITNGVLSADVQSDYNFNSTYKTKLDGIAANANLYVHPSYTAQASGLYKVTVDSSGHVSAVVAVVKSDITALGIPAQDTVYVHPASGVTAGTYRSVTVDVNGHVTTGTNPTTLAGYGITDAASASALSTLDANIDACIGALAGQVLSLQAKNQYDELFAEYINARTISSELFVGYLKGNADTATAFQSAKSITLTGDITGTASSTGGWSIATVIGTGKVTNAMLAGSIDNSKLVNSLITIAGTTVSLGSSISAATLRSNLSISNVQNTAFYQRIAYVNGGIYAMAGTNTADAFSIYAPTAAGTSGQLLVSSGGTPSWVSQGSGGGIDADKLDNMHAVDFVNIASVQTITGLKTFSAAVSMLNSLSVANNINAGGIIIGVGGIFSGGIADLGGSEYSIPAASASNIGGIKIGYTNNYKNYKVQLDTSGNAFVNVPWTDTTYALGSAAYTDSSAYAAATHYHSQYLEELSWITPTLTNGTQGTTYGTVRYRLIGTNVQIDGSFVITWDGSSQLRLFNLPSGYNPTHNMTGWLYNNSNGIWRYVIGTDGWVTLINVKSVTDGSNITTDTTCMFDKCIFPRN